jgi:hypothetical protein
MKAIKASDAEQPVTPGAPPLESADAMKIRERNSHDGRFVAKSKTPDETENVTKNSPNLPDSLETVTKDRDLQMDTPKAKSGPTVTRSDNSEPVVAKVPDALCETPVCKSEDLELEFTGTSTPNSVATKSETLDTAKVMDITKPDQHKDSDEEPLPVESAKPRDAVVVTPARNCSRFEQLQKTIENCKKNLGIKETEVRIHRFHRRPPSWFQWGCIYTYTSAGTWGAKCITYNAFCPPGTS